jgi:hypothetical protein
MYGLNIIERYIHSLPEYSFAAQTSNFIEICSYNGLLLTKKVIGKYKILLVHVICMWQCRDRKFSHF